MHTGFPFQHHHPWSGQFDGKNALCTNNDVAAPGITEGTCSPESTDWGADDEAPEERRLKNKLGRAERTQKSQSAP
jgi:hypothetical protein